MSLTQWRIFFLKLFVDIILQNGLPEIFLASIIAQFVWTLCFRSPVRNLLSELKYAPDRVFYIFQSHWIHFSYPFGGQLIESMVLTPSLWDSDNFKSPYLKKRKKEKKIPLINKYNTILNIGNMSYCFGKCVNFSSLKWCHICKEHAIVGWEQSWVMHAGCAHWQLARCSLPKPNNFLPLTLLTLERYARVQGN